MKKQWMAALWMVVMLAGCLEPPALGMDEDMMAPDVEELDAGADSDVTGDADMGCVCAEGVCDDQGQCVACVEDADCSGDDVCEDNACVACRQGGQGCEGEDVCVTSGDEPVCAQCAGDDDCDGRPCVDNQCVTCMGDRGCQGDEVCDETVPGGACVTCIENDQCTTPGTPVCDLATNECAGCTGDEQCEGFFEVNLCVAGSCIECTPETERDACASGGIRRSCLRGGTTCTDTEIGSVPQGMPCQADSECTDGACIQLTYTGPGGPRELGGVCLVERTGTGCPEGFGKTVRLGSVDGAPSSVARCGVNTALTTPQAVLESLGTPKTCQAPEECGVMGLGDATCLDGGRDHCSPACLNDTDCPTGISCFGGYCDF